jgi:hypothetical protein
MVATKAPPRDSLEALAMTEAAYVETTRRLDL